MADIREFNRYIWRATGESANGVPLHVHLVRGQQYAAWVDTGQAGMFEQLLALMAQAEVDPSEVGVLLHTHPHYDHMGCTGRLRQRTGALVAGHPDHAAWHSDFEVHVQRYALSFPDITEDTPALRAGVLEHLDQPHAQDIHLQEGVIFDLGDCQLQVLEFAGHMDHELGFFEPSTRTLLLGDTLTPLDSPILFGHLSVAGYRKTLDKLMTLLEDLAVQQVLLSHFPPLSAGQLQDLIADTAAYLDRLDTIVLNLITGHGEIHLRDLLTEVCDTLDRRADYRALRTVEAHARDLNRRGKVRVLEPLTYGPDE